MHVRATSTSDEPESERIKRDLAKLCVSFWSAWNDQADAAAEAERIVSNPIR